MLEFIKKHRYHIVSLFILMVMIFPVIMPLLREGFFVTDDGEWMIIRFSAFHQAFRDGQFPVRFLGRLNHGFGYPVANFLYPGFMYLAEPIHILGLGFVGTVKTIVGLSIVGSGVFSYLWIATLFRKNPNIEYRNPKQSHSPISGLRISSLNIPSLVGALVYVYTPYHLYDLYKRGSVGELVSLAIVPFILWQIERKSFFWTASGIAFLIISHNTLAMLFLPVIIIYLTLRLIHQKVKKELIYQYTSILVLGVGMTAFFWMPALMELGFTRFSTTEISKINEYFADLPLIGLSSFIILISAGIAGFMTILSKKKTYTESLWLFFLLLTIVSIFFSISASEALWNVLPVWFVQFPFRVLSFAILGVSYLAAYAVNNTKGKWSFCFAIILITLTIYSGWPFKAPKEYTNKGEGFYATNEDTTTVKNEYMPIWVKTDPTQHPEEKIFVTQGTGSISDVTYNSKRIKLTMNNPSEGIIGINTIYYPGWKAFLQNSSGEKREVAIDYKNEQGIMQVPFDSTTSMIELIFSETPTRSSGNMVSALSILALLGYTGVQRIKKNNN